MKKEQVKIQGKWLDCTKILRYGNGAIYYMISDPNSGFSGYGWIGEKNVNFRVIKTNGKKR